MKFRTIVILGLSFVLATSSCSSVSDDKPSAQAKPVSNSANSNSTAISNGTEVGPPHTLDANANTSASADPVARPGDLGQQKLENLRKAGSEGPPVDAAAVAAKNARPAPDNSTFTSYLTDAGYEIRTFKNHPQLLKVEKKVTNDGNQTLKVFLKGGKVIELPGNLINPLATASAQHILNIAGVRAPQTQPAPAGPAPVKKSSE